jgi:hypothetical protein
MSNLEDMQSWKKIKEENTNNDTTPLYAFIEEDLK